MEFQRENFAIVFNPRQRLLHVSLVVECGLGGGPGQRRHAETPSEPRTPARGLRARTERPSRLARRARAARTRAQKRGVHP